MQRAVTLAFLLLPVCAASAAAQGSGAPPSERITVAEIDGHMRFLSSDLLEGRAPATRGGRLTEEYLAAQLRIAGAEPAVGGSYFQEVPIEVVGAEPSTIRVAASGKADAVLGHPEDVVVWAGSAAEKSEARGELVFVGYGSTAPEYRWDDFKGVDVKDKILLVLVNDPPASAAEPDLFGGKAMTYYGRWTYKFEEAERRGAKGMLIVHTTEEASYPWQTVVGSWGAEQRMLPRDPALPAPLGFRGWITDDAARALLAEAGLDLGRLRKAAQRRSFRPVPTGITLDVGFRNRVERLQSRNVVGVIPGSDPALKEQYVAYSAHWDHLGIGPAVDGDSIYNGAVDNTTGVASVLAIARAAADAPRPKRSLLFVLVTAEESGLLGSAYFAQSSPIPARSIVAAINLDMLQPLGRVTSLRALGDTKSSLGPALAEHLRPLGVRIVPDPHPERGSFYRSDHFSFASAGIPAISLAEALDFEGRPTEWAAARKDEFNARHYHRPSDEYREDFDLSGIAQIAGIALDFGTRLANSPTVPTWRPDSEFAALRK